MSTTKRSMFLNLSTDKALGAVGGGLAAASLGFGVYMNVHGPVASFGQSRDFTVFAQLTAPRTRRIETLQPAATPTKDGDLDTTATASIQASRAEAELAAEAERETSQVISSVTLQAIEDDAATVAIDGTLRTVHVGDSVPTAGEVLEIRPGARPSVKTSLGLILSARR